MVVVLCADWHGAQVMSASLAAYCECAYGEDDARKNAVMAPSPHPNDAEDAADAFAVTLGNTLRWLGDARLALFLRANRLSVLHYFGWPHGPMADLGELAYQLWGSGAGEAAIGRLGAVAEGTAHARL